MFDCFSSRKACKAKCRQERRRGLQVIPSPYFSSLVSCASMTRKMRVSYLVYLSREQGVKLISRSFQKEDQADKKSRACCERGQAAPGPHVTPTKEALCLTEMAYEGRQQSSLSLTVCSLQFLEKNNRRWPTIVGLSRSQQSLCRGSSYC